MKNILFWFKNARTISLPQSLLPALTAAALSFGSGEFNIVAAILCIIGVALLHMAMNLADDWFDYKAGSAEARMSVADQGFRGRMVKYPYLTSGEATPEQLLKAVIIMLGAAAAAGIGVMAIRGWMVAWWMLAGLLIGISYSGGPLKLSFHGFGELVIFIMFGPLMMTGVYYSITGTVDWKIAWLSIAIGLLVTNIVYSHSVLDAIPDAKMGKKTMAHLMGGKRGQIALSAFLNITPYIIVIIGVLLSQLHPAYLAVLVIMPVSIWLIKSLNDFVNNRNVPAEPKFWMGPMGNFDGYRKAGIDWFLLRWLTARNIVMMFCIILITVNFIVR